MFRSFGHEKSSVLDGGLPRWCDEGYPIESLPPSVPKLGSYSTPELKKDAVRSNYYPLIRHASVQYSKQIMSI